LFWPVPPNIRGYQSKNSTSTLRAQAPGSRQSALGESFSTGRAGAGNLPPPQNGGRINPIDAARQGSPRSEEASGNFLRLFWDTATPLTSGAARKKAHRRPFLLMDRVHSKELGKKSASSPTRTLCTISVPEVDPFRQHWKVPSRAVGFGV